METIQTMICLCFMGKLKPSVLTAIRDSRTVQRPPEVGKSIMTFQVKTSDFVTKPAKMVFHVFFFPWMKLSEKWNQK